jgi:hypothetical protein
MRKREDKFSVLSHLAAIGLLITAIIIMKGVV